MIWIALQIETWCQHPINFLETVLGFDICLSKRILWSLLGVSQESVGCLWGHLCESDSNQIWRADFKSSSNLESWFEQLSKLRPGVISNKFLLLGLMWVCPKSVGSLQIETWCHIQQIPAVGSNTCLSEVCYESVRSQSGVCQESVSSLLEVCHKYDDNQIWRANLDSSPNWDLVSSPTVS